MSNKVTDKKNNRRKVIGSLVAGGALGSAGGWSKPVINSVLLPAHADMSEVVVVDTTEPLTFPSEGDLEQGIVASIVATPAQDEASVSGFYYDVEVSGTIIGDNPGGITINIEVDDGAQQLTDTATTDASGNYGPVTIGSFNGCDLDAYLNSIVIATATSASVTGEATTTVMHEKKCAVYTT